MAVRKHFSEIKYGISEMIVIFWKVPRPDFSTQTWNCDNQWSTDPEWQNWDN